MAAYKFNQKEYENWIKNTEEYKKLPATHPFKQPNGLSSKDAADFFRPLYAKNLLDTYGQEAVAEFKKQKPFEEKIEVVETQPIVENVVSTAPQTEVGTPISRAAVTSAENKYDKYLKSGGKYKEEQILKGMADPKALKGQAAAYSGLAGLNALMGIGQMIKGKKAMKGLNAPKYPELLAENQQLATRLAQAQVEAQMADPVIREKLLSDLASQKMVADEQAKVASGGDISAYGAMTQASQGGINKALRDIAVQEATDKLAKQQVLDRLIGAKMGEQRELYEDKLNKFRTVDYPEYQAKREYTQNLINTGLGNLLASAKTGSEMTAPFVQAKSAEQGLANQISKLSPEKQAEMLKLYPSLKKFMPTTTAQKTTPPIEEEIIKEPVGLKISKAEVPFGVNKFIKSPYMISQGITPYSLMRTSDFSTQPSTLFDYWLNATKPKRISLYPYK